MERIIDQQRKNLFYPNGSSYAADTGGRLKNLRESCSLEKVRQYHRQFYHPNNMFITVSGIVDHGQLLGAIEKVEGRYLDRIPKNFQRPFQTRLPEIEPKKSRIICPSDDETVGVFEMSWRGPPATKTKETVLKILDDGKLDEAQFEAAKRSMVCELVNGQSTVKTTPMSAMLATIRNVGPNFTQELCNRIWTARMDDVLGKGSPAIRQLFDDAKSIRCIALNPSRIDEVNFESVEICKLTIPNTAGILIQFFNLLVL